MASLSAPNASWPGRPFPPDDQVEWEKGHRRLDRRRLKRVALTPEAIGLCGCGQVIAVRPACAGHADRGERGELGRKAGPPSDAIGHYATSVAAAERSDAELIEAIRGHWDAIENGAHHRRDVTFREDASGVSERGAAQVMTTLRNLALGLYELAEEREPTQAPSASSQCRQMTFTTALAWLRR